MRLSPAPATSSLSVPKSTLLLLQKYYRENHPDCARTLLLQVRASTVFNDLCIHDFAACFYFLLFPLWGNFSTDLVQVSRMAITLDAVVCTFSMRTHSIAQGRLLRSMEAYDEVCDVHLVHHQDTPV